MLFIDNLTITLKEQASSGPGISGKDKDIVQDISLSVSPGETVALVGESGSGKTVTALSVLRLFEQTAAVSYSGKILFDNTDLLTMDEDAIRSVRGRRIAMIFQEPMTSLNPVYTVGDQIMESLILHQGLSSADARKRTEELLDETGIDMPDKRIDSYPYQLSGGQRQRVMIAMALACSPALLIADEPTTALDVTIEKQILELIRRIQKKNNMAVLLITHDLNLVQKVAQRIHIMKDGRIVEQGPTDKIFDRPSDPYTIHLLQSVPKGVPDNKKKGRLLFSIKCVSCSFKGKPVGSFFRRRYEKIVAIDAVDLDIPQGATIGLVGESGSGKSTLGMAMLRLVPAQGSMIFYPENEAAIQWHSLSRKELRGIRRHVQVVFQDPFSSLSPRMNIEMILTEGMTANAIGTDKNERQEMIYQVLDEVGLDADMAGRYPHEFSGGQRQRIAIARALVLKPRLLILDEPTSALDVTIQAQIIELLQALQKKYNMSYLFISHDLRVIRAMADGIAVMQKGRIVEQGPAESLFANPQHPYTKLLFDAAFGE